MTSSEHDGRPGRILIAEDDLVAGRFLVNLLGGRGGPESTRAGESEMAALALGATLLHEELQDTQIAEGDPTIGAISRVVEKVRPTVIYTHSLHDVHQDHRNTHQAAMVAVREIGHVYCFQSPSATVDFRPTRFVTIDEQLERKLLAIQAFASQVQVRGYLKPDLIQSTARYWSRYGDGDYAEAFEVIRDAAPASPSGDQAAGQAAAAPGHGLSAAPGGAAHPPAAHPPADAPEPAVALSSRPEVPHASR